MATLRRSPVFSFLSALALGSIVLTTLLPGLAFGAPLVAITRPVQGAVVSGQIWIDVAFNASNNLPVTRLEVYIDDQLAREVDLAQPMLMGRQSFNWDFSYSSNSTHKIGARAIDSGNNSAVAAISVQVQNAAAAGPDVIAPVVRIYYPAQGAKVHDTTEIKAEATDNVGVELVYFYIDGRLHKMMMNAPPYVDAWDTTREVDGLHVLEAVAVDKAENEARSAQVTVVVENRSATAMAPGGPLKTQGLGSSTLPTVPPTPAPIGVPVPAPIAPTLDTAAVPTPTPAPTPAPVVTSEPSTGIATAGTVPTPAPIAPAPAVTGATLPSVPPTPAPSGDRAPAPIAPAPAPPVKIVTVAPWVQPPTYVPPPPTITLPPVGSSSPVAVASDRQSGLAPAILSARTVTGGEAGVLARPGVDASRPGATSALSTAPKTEAPAGAASVATMDVARTTPTTTADTASGPVAIKTTQATTAVLPPRAATTSGLQAETALPTTTQPRLALSSPPLPALAKTTAPAGELRTSAVGRTSLPTGSVVAVESTAPVQTPTHQPGLAPLPVRPSRPAVTRVEPVGPAVAITASQPVAVQPATILTPEKTGPASGLWRITVPSTPPAPKTPVATKPVAPAPKPVAPAKVAAGVRPTVSPLITDAALAEYRGLPVPAYRMTARLPEGGAARVAADGRTTTPEGAIAAIPVAIAKVRDIKIVFDGEVLSLRATPETRRGISLAPLREIFEQTDGVLYWFPVEKQVRAVNKGVDVNLKIGDPKVTVNGEQRVLQIAPYIKRGRTMVPLQFIADVLDVSIAVNSATGDIMISSNQL